MKIFKSIKWRLQLWYGFFLAVMIFAGFATDYQAKCYRKFNEIDSKLEVFYGGLLNFIQSQPPPDRMGGSFPEGPPPFPRRSRELQFQSSLRDYINNPAFNLPGTNRVYYVIWTPEGNEWMRSTNAPTGLAFPSQEGPRTRGLYREMVDDRNPPLRGLPPDCTILIGLCIAPELNELHRDLLHDIIVGALMLVGVLCAGWGIANRVMKPIENISATASKISAGDLSQRINAAETESELGQLAAVLNSTFARLEAAFAQQRQFAADAAHELRTPVSVMLTQTQTALNRERAAAEYRETVEACQRSAQRMRRLIESLLELARLDAGQEPMKRVPFDLAQTALDCVKTVRPLADERGVKIHCDLPPMKYTGDAERLAQVLTNLLANAVQYNREKGEVRLTAKSENRMAVLTVADTGPGIPAADLPHIFERFYRADKSRSSTHAGLGLAIAKAIIEAHGGTLEVSSVENVGTTFTIQLPV